MLVGFVWMVGGWECRLEAMKIESEGCCVRLGRVESISKVRDEGVATPTETILDERVGELGLVK